MIPYSVSNPSNLKYYNMADFTVRVVDEDDKPWVGITVALGFQGLLRGMSGDEYTDEDGRAEFTDYDEGTAKVFIRGDNYGEYYFEDGNEITITK